MFFLGFVCGAFPVLYTGGDHNLRSWFSSKNVNNGSHCLFVHSVHWRLSPSPCCLSFKTTGKWSVSNLRVKTAFRDWFCGRRMIWCFTPPKKKLTRKDSLSEVRVINFGNFLQRRLKVINECDAAMSILHLTSSGAHECRSRCQLQRIPVPLPDNKVRTYIQVSRSQNWLINAEISVNFRAITVDCNKRCSWCGAKTVIFDGGRVSLGVLLHPREPPSWFVSLFYFICIHMPWQFLLWKSQFLASENKTAWLWIWIDARCLIVWRKRDFWTIACIAMMVQGCFAIASSKLH